MTFKRESCPEDLCGHSKPEACHWGFIELHFHSQNTYSPQKGTKLSTEQINLDTWGQYKSGLGSVSTVWSKPWDTPVSNTEHNDLPGHSQKTSAHRANTLPAEKVGCFFSLELRSQCSWMSTTQRSLGQHAGCWKQSPKAMCTWEAGPTLNPHTLINHTAKCDKIPRAIRAPNSCKGERCAHTAAPWDTWGRHPRKDQHNQDHTWAAPSHGKLWIWSTDKQGSVLNSQRAVPQSRHLEEPTAYLHISMDSMEKPGLVNLGLPQEQWEAFLCSCASPEQWGLLGLASGQCTQPHSLRAKKHSSLQKEKKCQTEDLAKPPKASVSDIPKVTTVIQDMICLYCEAHYTEASLFLEVDIAAIEC